MKTTKRYFKLKNPVKTPVKKTLKMRNKLASKNKKGGAIKTLKYPNKNVYVGDVKDTGDYETPHGRGKMTFSEGSTYEGDYVDGKMEGEGRLIFSSGLIYTGQVKNNAFNGQGEIIFEDGLIYTGEIKDNNPHGDGKMTYPNGRILTGKWHKNKIVVQAKWIKNRQKIFTGTMTDSNGRNAVTGNWMNAETLNPIISKKIGDNRYEGEICLNKAKPHGFGKIYFENGDVYEGNWKNGKMHGKGIYKYSDGKIFEGNWNNGEREGETGKYKLPSNAEIGEDLFSEDYDY